ncbi:peptidase C14, caspase domain-containing protein, partial [Fomitopsis serialis]|uniref:peptidase C14, caspase domain-containing protein n=1 Tax=Fomitopsis serialis TaxID=139415 RepID=UPI002007AA1E
MASPSSMRQLSPCLTSQPGLRLLGTGRIFALITGVNSYQYPYALHGAVNDAEAIADYLRKNFVDCKCKMLLDDQATRAAIEANFCDFLINNDDIGQGDPIIFYFAGHGSEICEDCDDIKQAICPHDFDIMNEGPTSIKLDQIREWLQFVAAKRGNNIVVILDCCYNAPASAMNYLRDQAVVRVRCIPSRTDVSPETQERHLKQDRHPTSMRGGVPYFPWIDAYVLMHACRRSEPAIEEPSPRCPGTPARGAFTSALIEHLIDIDQREEQTTYKLLVCGLSGLPQGQHPFCVGLH